MTAYSHTYKDLEYEALKSRKARERYASVPIEEKQALATAVVPDATIRQYYYYAILDGRGEMDGIGRGIYVYWNAEGQIIDVSLVPMDEIGFPSMTAPTAYLLTELDISHGVAPYRQGGDGLVDWEETEAVMHRLADDIRAWVLDILPNPNHNRV